MERTKKEYLALLEETIKYYSEDPSRRAVYYTDYIHQCTYFDSNNGNMCAVGRCMTNPSELDPDVINSDIDAFEDLDQLLKPDYRGFDNTFWMELQGMHDNNTNWNDNGLSHEGKENLRYLEDWVNQNY